MPISSLILDAVLLHEQGLNRKKEKVKQTKPQKKVANKPEEIFQLLLSNQQQLPPNLLLEAWLHPSVKNMSLTICLEVEKSRKRIEIEPALEHQ